MARKKRRDSISRALADGEEIDGYAIAKPRGVVTGAGGGIGKAVVRRLLRECACVLAVDAEADRLAELDGADCETLVGDVTDETVRAKIAE
jgi:NAD(P)-dependent dehydrogenase (short-subunit alcohol dehydrogenase family)